MRIKPGLMTTIALMIIISLGVSTTIVIYRSGNEIMSTFFSSRAPHSQIDKMVSNNSPLNLFEGIIRGDLRRVRLTYISTDLQMLELNDLLYIVGEPEVTLVADFAKVEDDIVINITLTVRGSAKVFDNGRLVKTIREFNYESSLLLEWHEDTYYLDGKRVGALPFLAYPSERVHISSVYIVEKGGELNTTDQNLVDLYITNPVEAIIDLDSRMAYIPGFNKSLSLESLPTVYYEIANISGKDKLYLLHYTNSTVKLPFSITGAIIERDTGVVLSFDLIGSPKVRKDAFLQYNETEFEYYPVSPLGLYFNLLTPKTFFELVTIEVEQA